MQELLAADPVALAELIALDEVARAFAAAEAQDAAGSPEEAGRRAAAGAGALAARSVAPAPHDGVVTLRPREVAVDEILPPGTTRRFRPGRVLDWVASLVAGLLRKR